MRQQTSLDSLLLNLWRKSAKPNSRLSSYKKLFLQGLVRKLLRKQGMSNCLSRWTAGGRKKILKTKTFHTTKYRAYLHKKLSTSKGVIKSRELVLAKEEEIASALGKQGVTNIRRISIRKGEERIQTNTYILMFNKPRNPKEVKIGYCFERVEQYIPALLRCFKCQRHGHHKKPVEDDRYVPNAVKTGPDRVEEDCLKQIWCANCQQDHPAYARSWDVSKKEKEILEVKHKRNMSFLEGRKIVRNNMGESSHDSVTWRVNTTKQDNKYWTLVEKLIELEANDRPKFQEHLKNYTRPNFTKPQLSNRLGMEKDPML